MSCHFLLGRRASTELAKFWFLCQKKMTRHKKRALSAVKNWLYNQQSYTARRKNGVIPLCLCTIFIALPALASLKTWSAPMKPVRLAPIAEVQTPNGSLSAANLKHGAKPFKVGPVRPMPPKPLRGGGPCRGRRLWRLRYVAKSRYVSMIQAVFLRKKGPGRVICPSLCVRTMPHGSCK